MTFVTFSRIVCENIRSSDPAYRGGIICADAGKLIRQSTNYIKNAKKGKNIGGWFILRSVGNKAVDILFVMGNDRKACLTSLLATAIMASFPGFPFCLSLV